MKCPQCGTEFETSVEQCFTCGWEFGQSPQDFKPRTSKLAVLTLVLGILCLFTFYLPLLAVLIVGVIALRKIRKSRGRLTGERLAMTGILIPLLSLPIIPTIGYAIWSKDAGPVPNEFTEADFKQVRPENEVTYSILCKLNDKKDDPNGAPAIGLNAEDIDQIDELWDTLDLDEMQPSYDYIRQQAETIDRLWERSAKGRFVIEAVNNYDQIADSSSVSQDLDSEVPYNRDMKLLMQINSLHVLLMMDRGDDLLACRELIEFDAVARKQSVFARSIILKLICYAVFNMDMKTANLLANHPRISKEGLQLLRSHFNPLQDEQISLENSIVHEYLWFKNILCDSYESNLTNSPFFKTNSTCRYYDGFCRNWILKDQGQARHDHSPVSVWPWSEPVYPKVSLDPDRLYEGSFTTYSFYNFVGTLYIKSTLPALDKVFEIKEKILIHDDLLQWVLARRLGQEGSLTARAYSDSYTVDIEKGLVFSVGPDEGPFTDDDIKLPINPAVLGLK